MKLSQLIDELQRIKKDAFDPFDPEIRVILSGVPSSACHVHISGVELDGNGYVYMDLEEV